MKKGRIKLGWVPVSQTMWIPMNSRRPRAKQDFPSIGDTVS